VSWDCTISESELAVSWFHSCHESAWSDGYATRVRTRQSGFESRHGRFLSLFLIAKEFICVCIASFRTDCGSYQAHLLRQVKSEFDQDMGCVGC
jgi:hypothetical protein